MTTIEDGKVRGMYMAYAHDGLIDLFAGLVIAAGGLLIFTDLFFLIGGWAIALVPAFIAAKTLITMKRLPLEELDPAMANRLTLLMTAVLVLGLLAALLGLALFLGLERDGFLGLDQEALTRAAGLGVGLLGLAAIVATGVALSAARWYLYGLGAVAAGLLAYWQGVELPWLIAAIGALIAVGGLVTLARFLHRYPAPADK